VVTYAGGTADLARLGALVYRARAVETLAESPVICFAQAGILTGTHASIEVAEAAPGEEPVAEARLRQMLGDFARSLSVENLATRTMTAAFEGGKRAIVEEQPFATVFGWSGIVVDADDWKGTYVLGNPQLLEEKLREVAPDTEDGPEEGGEPGGALSRVTSPLGRLLRRGGEAEGLPNGGQPTSESTAGRGLPNGGQPTSESTAGRGLPNGGQPTSESTAGRGLPNGPKLSSGGTAGRAMPSEDVTGASIRGATGDRHTEASGAGYELEDEDEVGAGWDEAPGAVAEPADAAEAEAGVEPEDAAGAEAEVVAEPETDSGTEPEVEKQGFFQRVASRASGLVARQGQEEGEEKGKEEATTEEARLLLAYTPDLVPLSDEQGMALLPAGLIPLCTVRYAERIRPEAIEAMRGFHDTGVAPKVFTGGPPERTAEVLRKAGLGPDPEFNLATITGEAWSKLGRDEKVDAAARHAIFGQMSPYQAADVVKALRAGGDPVAVVGDGISDLPALRQASLPISQKSSTQAALSASDMVLTGDSPIDLLAVLGKGQRIVNGLLDVLKLNLTQVFYLAFLIIAIRVFATGFPYQSAQGTAITVTTVVLPSLGLTFWAVAGVLSQASLGRTLVRFIAPAALTMGATGLVVYLIILDRTGEVVYAQLALTWTLVVCGLLLVVFVRPPVRRWLRGIAAGDPRPTILVVLLFVLFVIVSAVPLATELLKVAWLPERMDYVLVGVAAVAWAAVLRFIWFVFPIEPREPKRV
jgi:magnesium-transporting ATPase (P-type)